MVKQTQDESHNQEYTIFVSGLPYDKSDEEILSFFESCGTITYLFNSR